MWALVYRSWELALLTQHPKASWPPRTAEPPEVGSSMSTRRKGEPSSPGPCTGAATRQASWAIISWAPGTMNAQRGLRKQGKRPVGNGDVVAVTCGPLPALSSLSRMKPREQRDSECKSSLGHLPRGGHSPQPPLVATEARSRFRARASVPRLSLWS